MDSYCKKFVEDIFLTHDKDRNNVLERKELKSWIREELKAHKYFNRKMVQKSYEDFFNKVDTNRDGKIDRWELYDYCLKNITPEWFEYLSSCRFCLHIFQARYNTSKHNKKFYCSFAVIWVNVSGGWRYLRFRSKIK